jgi:hypothetical protein
MGYETYFADELTINPPITSDHAAELERFIEERHDDAPYPGIWCGWHLESGSLVATDGKNYEYIEWLQYLIDHYFAPWGYTLSGEVFWDGEESEDRGKIEVTDNKVDVYVAAYTWVKDPAMSPAPKPPLQPTAPTFRDDWTDPT